MCGRFAITLTPDEYRAAFGYGERPNFPPRYNVAPTQPVPIVHRERGERRFRLVRWGFLPAWLKDAKGFPLLFNARADTLLHKATFRGAMRYRRCVFLADGFYEWRREGRAKTPFLIRRRDRAPLMLAGLWETYLSADGSEMDTAAIVTTDVNGVLAAIHHRMPAMLDPANVERWLDTDAVGPEEAAGLVKPCPEDWIEMVEVDPRVNKADNDDPDLQEPVGPTPQATDTGRLSPAQADVHRADPDAQGRLF